MSSPSHQDYRKILLFWCRSHSHEPDVPEALLQYKDALLVLWHLDLTPAKKILLPCYATHPRGSDPWPPLTLLRSLLLMLLLGQTSINKWVQQLRGSRLLRLLCGFPEKGRRKSPGVGTFYDFLHRLHDGPLRKDCPHQMRPSSQERRRARSQRPKLKQPKKQKLKKAERNARKQRQKKDPVAAEPKDLAVTERLVAALAAAEHLPNPDDLLGRLSAILFEVGVLESARRGLLGDLKNIVLCGDGSALRTGASGQGKRVCSHGKREKCECPRRYADGDAAWGYDSYREQYFFGHHFYELLVSSEGHDLPLHVRLDPGNETDFTASLRALSHLKKTVCAQKLDWRVFAGVFDCGHDSGAFARYLVERDITPIIPLSKPAPATHPQRPLLPLSARGVPLCQAGAEMAPWGSAGKTHKVFVCPVNATLLARCPLAPPNEPGWRCRPELVVGPVVNLRVLQNPRLCPPIPRNSPRYEELYGLRSGCERSNGAKKETLHLEGARHRRASFWLSRLTLCALLQHAKVWVCEEKASELVRHLLGEPAAQAA